MAADSPKPPSIPRRLADAKNPVHSRLSNAEILPIKRARCPQASDAGDDGTNALLVQDIIRTNETPGLVAPNIS